MAQYLSEDLRVRVIRSVEGGMSRNAAARRFGVSIASAVRWMAEDNVQGLSHICRASRLFSG